MNGLKVAAKAIGELGNSESPKDSNMQKYGFWYGLNGVPWCAIFVSWCYNQSGLSLDTIDSSKGMHYCPSALNHFKSTGEITKTPMAGDIVFFDWEGDGKPDHVGIFIQSRASSAGTFISIEGNTALGNDSNGGQVMIRVRDYKNAIFVHPKVLDL